MKPYRGLIIIKCEKKKGCLRSLKSNVMPECMDCTSAITEVIDLENKVLFKYRGWPETKNKEKVKQKGG